MVYANKDQVLMYNRTESEYVRQYEDIPETLEIGQKNRRN